MYLKLLLATSLTNFNGEEYLKQPLATSLIKFQWRGVLKTTLSDISNQ